MTTRGNAVLRRILIANRGEIAVRIIATCRRLGIATVLAASDADLDSVPARLADRVVRIGPAPATASYLDVSAVIAAARAERVDAMHPGYGFMAENPRLAEACPAAEIVFIGPTAEQLRAVGDKLMARRLAVVAGLPAADGGEAVSVDEATALARDLGLPVLIKAVGGGGRGLARLDDPADLRATLDRSMAEAQAAFRDARVYLERFITSARHIEVQVLGDGARVIHLGERDRSVQRRYQKLMEEAPAPGLDDRLRADIRRAPVDFSRHLAYRGAGTVEFLVDRARGTFAFRERHARILVEQPVTEMVCGVDLIAEQIAVAEGRQLRLAQEDVTMTGHAIECRITAEDWTRGFQPSPGTVSTAAFPAGEGIRVDTHLQAGATVRRTTTRCLPS